MQRRNRSSVEVAALRPPRAGNVGQRPVRCAAANLHGCLVAISTSPVSVYALALCERLAPNRLAAETIPPRRQTSTALPREKEPRRAHGVLGNPARPAEYNLGRTCQGWSREGLVEKRSLRKIRVRGAATKPSASDSAAVGHKPGGGSRQPLLPFQGAPCRHTRAPFARVVGWKEYDDWPPPQADRRSLSKRLRNSSR